MTLETSKRAGSQGQVRLMLLTQKHRLQHAHKLRLLIAGDAGSTLTM